MASGLVSVVSSDWATDAVVSVVTVETCDHCIFLAVPMEPGGLVAVVSSSTMCGMNGVVGGNPVASASMALFNVFQTLLICWPRPW